MSIKYDLHIHSCLSPCGDDEMTPASIAGMAHLTGLKLIALTDHNTAANLPAISAACEEYGIGVLYGLEVCTSEEIHILCYFNRLESAMSFGDYIESNMPKIKNKPEVYGNQIVMDSQDNIIRTVENLLILGCALSCYEIVEHCHEMGGVCYWAHIDRDSFSVISVLGTVPLDIKADGVEIYDLACRTQLIAQGHITKDTPYLSSSDAHYLWLIGENNQVMEENHPLYPFILG
ncbi:MAG: PHP domain-containing protein [Oscillospiraceae bacterium]